MTPLAPPVAAGGGGVPYSVRILTKIFVKLVIPMGFVGDTNDKVKLGLAQQINGSCGRWNPLKWKCNGPRKSVSFNMHNY